jgi:hypothetical protein
MSNSESLKSCGEEVSILNLASHANPYKDLRRPAPSIIKHNQVGTDRNIVSSTCQAAYQTETTTVYDDIDLSIEYDALVASLDVDQLVAQRFERNGLPNNSSICQTQKTSNQHSSLLGQHLPNTFHSPVSSMSESLNRVSQANPYKKLRWAAPPSIINFNQFGTGGSTVYHATHQTETNTVYDEIDFSTEEDALFASVDVDQLVAQRFDRGGMLNNSLDAAGRHTTSTSDNHNNSRNTTAQTTSTFKVSSTNHVTHQTEANTVYDDVDVSLEFDALFASLDVDQLVAQRFERNGLPNNSLNATAQQTTSTTTYHNNNYNAAAWATSTSKVSSTNHVTHQTEANTVYDDVDVSLEDDSLFASVDVDQLVAQRFERNGLPNNSLNATAQQTTSTTTYHNCDNYRAGKIHERRNLSIEANQILSLLDGLIVQMKGRGVTMAQLSELYRGSKNKSLTMCIDLGKLRNFGGGSKFSKADMDRIMHSLIFEGVLEEKSGVNASGFNSDFVHPGPRALEFQFCCLPFFVDFPQESSSSAKVIEPRENFVCIHMVDGIMGTESLPNVLALQDSTTEMAEQTEHKVCCSFA